MDYRSPMKLPHLSYIPDELFPTRWMVWRHILGRSRPRFSCGDVLAATACSGEGVYEQIVDVLARRLRSRCGRAGNWLRSHVGLWWDVWVLPCRGLHGLVLEAIWKPQSDGLEERKDECQQLRSSRSFDRLDLRPPWSAGSGHCSNIIASMYASRHLGALLC